MKMGVGGKSARTGWRLEDLAEALDEYVQDAEQHIDDELVVLSRVRRARRRLELRMWKTSPLFCRPR